MSRLNTKQRRARFRNSKTGKEATRDTIDVLGNKLYRKDAKQAWIKVVTDMYPLLRGSVIR